MNFDPFSAAVLADPAEGHVVLRRCPVQRYDDVDPPFYKLSTYKDVEWALRDIETFSSQFGQAPRFAEPIGMLCDPPQHTPYRALVQDAFTPRMIEGLRPRVQRVTEDLVDGFAERGRCDLHDDFAFPLAVAVIAELLGVPPADMDRFKHWSDVEVTAMGAKDPSPYVDEQSRYQAYLLEHMRGRRAAIDAEEWVPDDLLTRIAGARGDGDRLPESDVVSIFSQLLVGGNETTTSLIKNLVWRLLQEPARWQRLLSNSALIDPAIEDSLRFDPPVLGLYRHTTRDVTVRGRRIPKGSKVLLQYAAPNRDPAVFEETDRFDLDRPRKRHLAFGIGVHFCLGATLAPPGAPRSRSRLIGTAPAFADASTRGQWRAHSPLFSWGRSALPESF